MDVSELIKALNRAWVKIQSTYEDVPDAVILVGSGGRRAATLYGHFASNSWARETEDGSSENIHEVLIVAEQLNRPAEDVFQTLLHEAVHGIASSRGIRDVSGRRHNKRFKALCEEVGMIPPEKADPTIGFSAARLSDLLKEKFSVEIKDIDQNLKAVRRLNLLAKPTKKTTWVGECECGRKIRLPKKTIDSPEHLMIDCGICGSEFKLDEDDLEDLYT